MHFFRIDTPHLDFTARSARSAQDQLFTADSAILAAVDLLCFFQMAIFALAAGRSVSAVMSMAFSVADGMLLFQA